MTVLAIVGKADKRILAYPLMKTCGLMGNACVVTDDAAYCRLYSGPEDSGSINDVQIRIVRNLDDAHAAAIEEEQAKNGTDYLLYLTERFVPAAAEKVLALCSPSRTFVGEELEGVLERDEEGRIAFATLTIRPKAKGYWKIPLMQLVWRAEYLQYICETEELRILTPLRDKPVNRLLCTVFCRPLSLQESSMLKIMERKLV